MRRRELACARWLRGRQGVASLVRVPLTRNSFRPFVVAIGFSRSPSGDSLQFVSLLLVIELDGCFLFVPEKIRNETQIRLQRKAKEGGMSFTQ